MRASCQLAKLQKIGISAIRPRVQMATELLVAGQVTHVCNRVCAFKDGTESSTVELVRTRSGNHRIACRWRLKVC